MLKHKLINNRTGNPVKMYNLSGRTEKQQSAVDAKLKRHGCLWGNIPILYEFIFTRTELNAVERAKQTLKNHRAKLYRLTGKEEYIKYL